VLDPNDDAHRLSLAAEQVSEVEKSSVELLNLIAKGGGSPDFVPKVKDFLTMGLSTC